MKMLQRFCDEEINMDKIWRVFSAMIAVAIFSCAVGRGAIITIGVEAEVTYVDDLQDLLGGSIGIGDIITGSYSYNSDTPDTNPLSTVGDYWHYSAPYGISLGAGGLLFQTDPTGVDFLVEVGDNHTGQDAYLLRSYSNLTLASGVSVDHISWQLNDYSCTALSSDDLPLVPPVLGDWESNYLLITLGPKGSSSIQGTVTDVWLIPEPGSIFVLGLGALGLWRRRKKRSRCR